jgi:excisionase family DNA binding protein
MVPKPETRPLAHNVSHAVRVTGISRSLLYDLIKRGELAIIKIGRRTLIAEDDLEALIARHRVTRVAACRPRAFPPTGLYRADVTEQT